MPWNFCGERSASGGDTSGEKRDGTPGPASGSASLWRLLPQHRQIVVQLEEWASKALHMLRAIGKVTEQISG